MTYAVRITLDAPRAEYGVEQVAMAVAHALNEEMSSDLIVREFAVELED